jgi:hypothetical protein
MDSLEDCQEMSIFDTKIVKDFYDFHWHNYAKHIHYFGAAVHFIYLILFVCYVNEVYLHRHFELRVQMCWLMLICIIFPIINDGLQLRNQGFVYLQDPWNYVDMANIIGGISNIVI